MAVTGTALASNIGWNPYLQNNTGISGGAGVLGGSTSRIPTSPTQLTAPTPSSYTMPSGSGSGGSSGRATYGLPGGGSTTSFAEYSAAIARQRAQQSAPTAATGGAGGGYGGGSPASLPAPAMGQGVVDIKPNFNNPPEPPGGAMDGLQQAGQQPTMSMDASQKGGIRQGIGRRMYPDESGPLAALRRIY